MNRKQLENDFMLALITEIHEVFNMELRGIAKYLGVSENAIQLWKKGKINISSKHLLPLKKLHKQLSHLYGFDIKNPVI